MDGCGKVIIRELYQGISYKDESIRKLHAETELLKTKEKVLRKKYKLK